MLNQNSYQQSLSVYQKCAGTWSLTSSGLLDSLLRTEDSCFWADGMTSDMSQTRHMSLLMLQKYPVRLWLMDSDTRQVSSCKTSNNAELCPASPVTRPQHFWPFDCCDKTWSQWGTSGGCVMTWLLIPSLVTTWHQEGAVWRKYTW